MILVHSTPIDTIHAQQFELILTVESNEVIMDQALLRQFIVIAHLIKF